MKPDIASLIEQGWDKLKAERQQVNFETGCPEAEDRLNDIERFPHHFVLACIADRQIRANRAWIIPHKIGEILGSFEFKPLLLLSEEEFTELFRKEQFHRFNNRMGSVYFNAVQRIHNAYDDNACAIWCDSKSSPSARIVRRFLEFDGVGVKIATMATNILARDFKVKFKDYSSIDISPDRQVRKFLEHHKLIRPKAKQEEIIYLARELCPEYPGIIDLVAWEWGRKLR